MTSIRYNSRFRSLATILAVLLGAMFATACGTPDPLLDSTPTSQELDDESESDNVGADPSGKILFISDHEVAVWDDGDVRTVTDDANAASPSWSPDGQRFAFIEMSDGFSELMIADANGENVRQMTENEPNVELHSEGFAYLAAWALDPVWSRDGDQIIYASDFGGSDSFSDPLYLWYIEDVDNLNIPPYLLDASAGLGLFQENPTLSADGDSAAYVTRTDVTTTLRNTEIWTLDLNTGESTQLVGHPDGSYDPAWSPISDDVAYIQRDGNNNDVWVMPVEEDNDGIAYQLTHLGDCVAPAWSPDGRFLAFFRYEGSGFEAWYIEMTQDSTGKYAASEPKKLFDADNIDAPSGMSWIAD
jgi:TolB protein